MINGIPIALTKTPAQVYMLPLACVLLFIHRLFPLQLFFLSFTLIFFIHLHLRNIHMCIIVRISGREYVTILQAVCCRNPTTGMNANTQYKWREITPFVLCRPKVYHHPLYNPSSPLTQQYQHFQSQYHTSTPKRQHLYQASNYCNKKIKG